MADFAFIGPSYEAPSIYQNAEECINWRTEIDPTKQPGQRGVVALYPTPGLTLYQTLGALAEVRGLRTVSGGAYMIAVCGSAVYAINKSNLVTQIGSLLTTTGRVGISDNGLYVYITDGANRYQWYISDPTVTGSVFNAQLSGNQMNVTGITSGSLVVGQAITGTGVPPNTIITVLPSSGNGLGIYTLNNSVSNGTVTGIVVNSLGSGFTNPPTITVASPPFGTTATVVWNSLGVTGVTVTTGGTGYAVNDILTGFGGTYTKACQVKVTSVSAGVITGVSIYVVGAYSAAPTSPVVFNGGKGTGATLTLTVGLNSDYTITNSGSFYQSIPAISASSTTGSGETGTATISPLGSIVQITGTNFSLIPSTDGAFTGGNNVDVVDNYFIYNRPNSQQFAASSLLSPLTPPLSFASKDGAPDQLVTLIVDHREVYLLGEASSEVWVDVGSFPFAFQRIPGTSTQHGIAAQWSVSRVGNSFAYLTRNSRGQSEIAMMNGYQPQRISTHAVENTLVNQYVADAIAWTYQLEGHEVYVITFPSLDLTWAFDIATGMWHKWLWTDSDNVYHRHRGNCATVFQGIVYVGDYQNGNIYKLDPTNFTDNGQEIRRLRRAPHLVADLQRQFFSELQIQFQPGVGLQPVSATTSTTAVSGIAISGLAISGNSGSGLSTTLGVVPKAMLRWSDDGGSTWSKYNTMYLGQAGKYKNRAIFRRLSWSRDRVFEVSVTDPINAVMVSANLKGEGGEN